jgi:hypothetical protein
MSTHSSSLNFNRSKEMKDNIKIISFHQGFFILVLVAKSVVLILQLMFDQLFGVLIE